MMADKIDAEFDAHDAAVAERMKAEKTGQHETTCADGYRLRTEWKNGEIVRESGHPKTERNKKK